LCESRTRTSTPKHGKLIRLANWECQLPHKYIVASTPSANSLDIDIEIETTDTGVKFCTKSLVNCGATGLFMDTEWAHANNVTTHTLTRLIPVYNVDGMPNEGGAICKIADVILWYNRHAEHIQFVITQLGKQSMILGFTWLCKHNPEINWQTKEVCMSRCPARCNTCRLDTKREQKEQCAATAQICACQSSGFPMLIEEVEDKDDCICGGTEESEGGVPRPLPKKSDRFPKDLPDLVDIHDNNNNDDIEIEEGDRIFMATIHLKDIHHFVHASSTGLQRLAKVFMKNSGQASFRDSMPESLHDFEDIFSKESFDSLPNRHKWDHAIELERDPEPGFCKVYPMMLEEQEELDAFLEEALSTGRIRPSRSPIGAPVFFVKKKDGKLHFIQDYHMLNAITRKNRYPLPLIDDLIHRLRGARYFTKLDVRWGYNNVHIKEGNEWKVAFHMNRGLFEPLVMYFSLTNSSTTFQMMMNEIFHNLILQGVVIVYLDNILIFTDTLEEHRRISRIVMERLREHKLYLQHDKCEFEKTCIEYLGVIISHNCVEMNPIKITGVVEWPVPTSKKEVQSFVGFTNFYRRFISNFSHHARALFDLTKKDVRFMWGNCKQDTFDRLKELITSAPVLALLDNECPSCVEADGSGVATGAVLSQLSPEDDKWHVLVQEPQYGPTQLQDT
jgi:hypothetical protein